MHYENGRVQESALAYEAAVDLLPSDPALMGPAAKAMMEAGGEGRTARAIEMLERVTLLEPRNPSAWLHLGIGYGKMDRIGDASVALAEANMLNGRRADAGLQAAGEAILAQYDPPTQLPSLRRNEILIPILLDSDVPDLVGRF